MTSEAKGPHNNGITVVWVDEKQSISRSRSQLFMMAKYCILRSLTTDRPLARS